MRVMASFVLVCSIIAAQLATLPANAGPTYRVFGTREGLVGGTCANGHIIVTRDHFVALPSRLALDCNGCRAKTVTVRYKTRSITVPVWDVGPWNTRDDYWNEPRAYFQGIAKGIPEAQVAYYNGYNGGKDEKGRKVANGAGVDLADGVFWNDLGMVNNDWVDVTYNFVPGYTVGGAIKVKYDSLGGTGSFLGQPTTNEMVCPDQIGRYNHFQGGSIYWTQANGAWSIRGLIRDRWAALGWEAGVCGYPITDESGCPDAVGRFNHFTGKNAFGASIYYTPSTGANEVHGSIREHWKALGWETGVCGYPTTNETKCPDNIGYYNHFSKNASIYWSPSTGAWCVGGLIRDKWASLGWERSSLGYPKSDEYTPAGTNWRRSDFQNGTITFKPELNTCTVP